MTRKKHIIRRTKKLQEYCVNRACCECMFALRCISGFKDCRLTGIPQRWDLTTPFQHISNLNMLMHAQLIQAYCKKHCGPGDCIYCKFYVTELLSCTFDDVHEYSRYGSCEVSQWDCLSMISNKEDV